MTRPALDLSLYLVADPRLCGGPGVVETVALAISEGATVVQLRHPDCPDDEFVRLGRELKEVLAPEEVPLVVNDRAHLVAPIGADGVHVGQRDLPAERARDLVGTGACVGLSVQTVDHVEQARTLPTGTVDYLGVGPVWPQGTKPDAADASGPETLARIVTASSWPCVAIGGVDAARAAVVRRTGAHGVAVVSAICGRQDPAAATQALKHAWEDAR